MRDKEKKFETYLMKCRQDLDERNRTIENQSKALEKLKPIVERYEQELEKKEGRTSEQESDTSAPSKTSRVEESEASVLTVEYQELLDDNDNLTKEVERANLEITRLRNLLCDVSDVVDKNDLHKPNRQGQTFDYMSNMYATGDVDNPNLPDTLSKTFDLGAKPVVIPVLDLRKLKQVKAYKDWYGYVQKLEYSIKLLRLKIKKLEEERVDFNEKFNKLKAQIKVKNSKTIDNSRNAQKLNMQPKQDDEDDENENEYTNKINEDIDMQRVQIKNSTNIEKYVQRGKKRGHEKKNSQVPSEMIKEKFKKFEITDYEMVPKKKHSKKLSVFELSMGKYQAEKKPTINQILFN